MIQSLFIKYNKYHYLVIVAAIVIFAIGLRNQFNNWDDTVYVTENPAIALNGANIKNSFSGGERHGMYLPLTALSFSINHAISAFDPSAYLGTNLLIHLLNILLVFALLQKLFNNNALTLFAGALFALHPMQAESVSYVAGRRDTLYAVFYFLAMLSYINYIQKHDKKWLRNTMVFFVLSLFSKGQAIALPASLVLVDFLLLKDFSFKKSIKDKWAFIALSAVFIIITLVVKQHAKGFDLSGQIVELSFFKKMMFACYGFMMYIVNIIMPYKLSLIHPYPASLQITAGIVISLAFIAAFVFVSIKYIATQKEIVAGLLFFAVNIFLVLQIIPNSYGIMNDHYVYVPSLGIFIALYFILQKLADAKMLTYVFIGITCVAAFLLARRIPVFRDSITVFSDVIKKYPESYVGYNNRGTAYYNTGRLNDAKLDFDRSIMYNSKLATAFNNRAGIFINTAKPKDALTDLNKAIALDPAFANAYSNRGIALAMLGDKKAIDDLNKAVVLEPANPRMYYNRAAYWMNANRKDLACNDVAKARQLGLKEGNPALDKACQ